MAQEEVNPYKDFVHQAHADKINNYCDGLGKKKCDPNQAKGAFWQTFDDQIMKFAVPAMLMKFLASDLKSEIEGPKGLITRTSQETDRIAELKKDLQDLDSSISESDAQIRAEQINKDRSNVKGLNKSDRKKRKKENKDLRDKERNERKAEKEKKPNRICDQLTILSMGALHFYKQMKEKQSKDRYEATELEAQQTQALYTLAGVHQTNKVIMNTQFAVMTGIGACYTAAAIKSFALELEPKQIAITIAKAAAAGTLAVFSKKSANEHKQIERTTLQAASEIPNAGSCAPNADDNTCFCVTHAESSEQNHSQEYEAFCVDKSLRRGDTRNYAGACLAYDGQPDIECNCKKSNNCYDQNVAKQLQNYGGTFQSRQAILSAARDLSQGSFNPEQTANNLKKIQAITKKLESKNEAFANTPANPLSKSLQSMGLSPSTANLISQTPVTKKEIEQFGKIPRSIKSYEKKKANHQIAKTYDSSANSEINQLDFSSLWNKKEAVKEKKKKSYNYEKIRELASINKDETQNLFKIISNRYQLRKN